MCSKDGSKRPVIERFRVWEEESDGKRMMLRKGCPRRGCGAVECCWPLGSRH